MITKLGLPLTPPKIWGICISLKGLTVEIHQKDRKYQSAENRYYAFSEYELSANCALGCRRPWSAALTDISDFAFCKHIEFPIFSFDFEIILHVCHYKFCIDFYFRACSVHWACFFFSMRNATHTFKCSLHDVAVKITLICYMYFHLLFYLIVTFTTMLGNEHLEANT